MNEVESLLRKIVEVRQRMHDRAQSLNATKTVAGDEADVSEINLLNAQLELEKYLKSSQENES
jgi:hypothetical protein